MRNLKGNQLKNRNLLVKYYDTSIVASRQDPKTINCWLDVQMDARDVQPGEEQSNLNLYTVKRNDGTYSNQITYAPSQLAKMQEAAGDNIVQIPTQNGAMMTLMSINANIIPAKQGRGLVVDTSSPMTAGLAVDQNTYTNQLNASKEFRVIEQDRKVEQDTRAAAVAEMRAEALRKATAERTPIADAMKIEFTDEQIDQRISENKAKAEDAPKFEVEDLIDNGADMASLEESVER